MTVNAEKEPAVGEMVIKDPSRTRVFERFGIDHCCGGKTPLTDACAASGADFVAVLEALHESEVNASRMSERLGRENR